MFSLATSKIQFSVFFTPVNFCHSWTERREEPIQNVEGQLSKEKPIIRLLSSSCIPGTNDYSYLKRIFPIISVCSLSFNNINTNVKHILCITTDQYF